MAAFSSVLITGASRGLGLEFVKQFLELAHPPKHIFATCRDPASAQELAALASSNLAVLHILQLDISDVSQHERVVRQVSEVLGDEGLNLLINNAGTFTKSIQTIGDQTKDELMKHFEINTVSPILVTKAFLPLLKKAAEAPTDESVGVKKSAVAFVSSILGCFSPNIPKNNPYRYSKAALNMVIHGLANELQPEGILVTGLHPGWVKTDMGGPDGNFEKDFSVRGLLKVLLEMSESNRGKLYQYDGKELAW